MWGNWATVRCSKLNKFSIIFMLKICTENVCQSSGHSTGMHTVDTRTWYEASCYITTGSLVDMKWGMECGSFLYMYERNIGVGFERWMNRYSIFDEKWKAIVDHKANRCDILHIGGWAQCVAVKLNQINDILWIYRAFHVFNRSVRH